MDVPAEVIQPSEEEIINYYNTHKSQFISSDIVTLDHVYFSDASVERVKQTSVQLLAQIESEQWKTLGEPFPWGQSFKHLDIQQIEKRLGKSLTGQLKALPKNKWRGPIPGVYGYHFVKILDYQTGGIQPLAEVYDDIHAILKKSMIEKMNQERLHDIQGKYQIELPILTHGQERIRS